MCRGAADEQGPAWMQAMYGFSRSTKVQKREVF